jgi:hypothetical protein
METIEDKMQIWKDGDYINPDSLKAAYEVIEILIARIQELEQKVG